MSAELRVDGNRMIGTVAIVVPPGTRAAERDALLDAALGERVHALAAELGAAPAAAPSAYAWPRPGKDGEGRTTFDVCARAEGDRLLPFRKGIGVAGG